MSVLVAATELMREDLVQLNDLDPELRITMSGSLAGDATGGTSDITATVPAGKAGMIVASSCAITGIGTASNNVFRITLNGNTVNEQAQAPFNIATFQRFESWTPTPVLHIADTIAIISTIDNVDTQTHTCRYMIYLWDLVTARNIPQKFFWPGTLA